MQSITVISIFLQPEYGGPGGKYRIDFVVPPYTLERVEIHAFMKVCSQTNWLSRV